MKTYKVVVRTEHVYTEDELLRWMAACSANEMTPICFSATQERKVLQGETVRAAHDEMGTTYVQAKRTS